MGQRVVLPGLPNAVALAQPFHLNHGTGGSGHLLVIRRTANHFANHPLIETIR